MALHSKKRRGQPGHIYMTHFKFGDAPVILTEHIVNF